MRAARSLTASVVAAGLALSLVAAEPAQAQETAGEASTQMLGADVTVAGLGDEVTGRLLDVVTEATTIDAPFAASSVVPLSLAGQAAGAASASSDGQESADSDGGQLGSLAGVLGLSADPVRTTAEATADSAIATVDATTARLSGLFEVLGLELDTPGITSRVTPDGADALQGLSVSGFDLTLADLGLGADVLEQLGLSQVLDLLASLDLADGLPAGVSGDVAAVEDLQADLTSALASLDGLDASIRDALSELTALLDVDVAGLESQLTDLEGLLDTLNGLSTGNPLALVTDLGNVTGLPSGCGIDSPTLANVLTVLQDTITCVEGAIADLRTQLPTPDAVLDLLDGLAGDLGTLDSLLGEVTGIVQDLLDELGGLPGLLDTILGALPDLLADAAGTELLSIGAFDVGMNAEARDTVEESTATVLCAPTQVVVLGQVTSTPDCSEGLSAVAGLTDTLSGALGSVAGVLNTLPLVGDAVQVGDLKLELFGNLVEEVEEVDGMVTATAGFDVLDLQLPSITLDPEAVTGPLGDLGGLPTGDLQQLLDLVGDLPGTLGLDGLLDLPDLTGGQLSSLTDAIDEVTSALDAVDSTGTLSGLVDQVTTLLGDLTGLDLGELGTLGEQVATPGLSLVIDPESSASFEAAPVADDAEVPAPAAAPDDDPILPTTGGGLALAAILALAGAALLGGRRPE